MGLSYASDFCDEADERLARLLTTSQPGVKDAVHILQSYREGKTDNPTTSFSEHLAAATGRDEVSILAMAAKANKELVVLDPVCVQPTDMRVWEIERVPVYRLSSQPFGVDVIVSAMPCLPAEFIEKVRYWSGSKIVYQAITTNSLLQKYRLLLDSREVLYPATVDLLDANAPEPAYRGAWAEFGLPSESEGSEGSEDDLLLEYIKSGGDEIKYAEAASLLGKGPFITAGSIDNDILKKVSSDILSHYRTVPVCAMGRTLTLITGHRHEPGERARARQDMQIHNVYWLFGNADKVRDLQSKASVHDISSMDVRDRVHIKTGSEGPKQIQTINTEALRSTSEASIKELLDSILVEAITVKASDIHISAQPNHMRVRFRQDGICVEKDEGGYDTKYFKPMLRHIKSRSGLGPEDDIVPKNAKFDFALSEGAVYDVRVATCPTVHGGKVIMRLLERRETIPTLASLGINKREQGLIQRIVDADHGMALVCGPTGAGKSTSLYAVMGTIDRDKWVVISGEDPVEMQIPKMEQTDMQGGMGYKEFQQNMLRQDPDYVILSEIRDPEAAAQLVTAANTGHVVFTTVHCNTAAEAPLRLLDLQVEPYLLAQALKGVFAQRLVRRICPNCSRKVEPPSQAELKALRLTMEDFGPNPTFKEGTGCKSCSRTGYSGRIAVMEGYLVEEEISQQILRGTPDPRVITEVMRRQGGGVMFEYALGLVAQGLTTIKEAISIRAVVTTV